MNDLLNLFFAFFKVGSFSFGGAYSLIPLIEAETVKNYQWLTSDEFLKVLGMVEIIPGAISIKFATYTGYKVAGVPGVIAANLGNMIMPIILISIITFFYFKFENNEYVIKGFKGIYFAIIGMIIAIMIQYTIKSEPEIKSFLFMVLGFALIFFFKLHPIIVISSAMVLALLIL